MQRIISVSLLWVAVTFIFLAIELAGSAHMVKVSTVFAMAPYKWDRWCRSFASKPENHQ